MAINQIKDHVNGLVKEEAKLKDAKNAASPGQKAAIDRIVPYLDELEGSPPPSSNALPINLSASSPTSTRTSWKRMEANADYATDLAAMIGDFVDYGKTRDRLERLSNKLEIPRR